MDVIRPSDDAQVPKGPNQHRRDAEIAWYLGVCVLCFLLIVAGAVSAAAVKPGFCATCHSSESKTLAKSSHTGIACDSCHTAPTVAGVIDSRLAVIGMVPAQLFQASRPLSASVNNERCISCHKQILKGVTVSKSLRMNHRALYNQNWPCTRCHRRTAHATSKEPVIGYTMGMCLKCHAPNTYDLSLCDTCHVKSSPIPPTTGGLTAPWRITHGKNWRRTHGMGDPTTCAACHRENFCVKCHGIELPHPPTFAAEHGRQVLAREDGPTDCFTCHREVACRNCHGVEMPHPSGFIKKHRASVARQGEALCLRCHEKSSCTGCHVEHIHPGIPADVIRKLRGRPAT